MVFFQGGQDIFQSLLHFLFFRLGQKEYINPFFTFETEKGCACCWTWIEQAALKKLFQGQTPWLALRSEKRKNGSNSLSASRRTAWCSSENQRKFCGANNPEPGGGRHSIPYMQKLLLIDRSLS